VKALNGYTLVVESDGVSWPLLGAVRFTQTFADVQFGIAGECCGKRPCKLIRRLVALIATLRGLFVKKVLADQHNRNTPDGSTTSSASLTGTEAAHLSAPPVVPSLPEVSPPVQPTAFILDKPRMQAIYCHKCNHENTPDATNCSQCGTDLLPGAGAGERIGVFISTIIIGFLSFGAVYLYFRFNAQWGVKDFFIIGALIVFGTLMIIVGIFSSLRKIPPYERYETRAKRHVTSNPLQATVDYGSAINIAPQTQAFDFMLERAKLFQGLGMTTEARTDWQHALDNINGRMAMPKAPIDLIRQRAEICKDLGMEDEYAMQMLRYTIEKEKTFKTKRSDIAMGWEEGLKKGSEDFNRQELEKIRAEILANPKYKIVGQCKNCHSVVDLNAGLECTNNVKHRKITEISPTLKTTDTL
jgi:ribosomal protein L40E